MAGKAAFVGWSLVVPWLVFRSGWVFVSFVLGSLTLPCHRQNGTLLKLPLCVGVSAEAAKHAAAEAMLALGANYDAQPLALLTRPSA